MTLPTISHADLAGKTQEMVDRVQHGEIAVDQSRRSGRCRRRVVALLEQNHPQAASGGIARNADTVQTAADDR